MAWQAVWVIYPPKVKEVPAEVAIAKMPPMAKNEKVLSWLIGLTMALWFLTDLTKIHVSAVGGLFIVVCMALWYPVVGMPGNVDSMKPPAKLTPSGYELVVSK